MLIVYINAWSYMDRCMLHVIIHDIKPNDRNPAQILFIPTSTYHSSIFIKDRLCYENK